MSQKLQFENIGLALIGPLALMCTMAARPVSAQNTTQKCDQTCQRTFFKAFKRVDVTDIRVHPTGDTTGTGEENKDANVKAAAEEDAKKKSKAYGDKILKEGLVTTPCEDPNCDCKKKAERDKPVYPQPGTAGGMKEKEANEEEKLDPAQHGDFPYDYKGGSGVDKTITYDYRLTYLRKNRSAPLPCGCEPRRPQ